MKPSVICCFLTAFGFIVVVSSFHFPRSRQLRAVALRQALTSSPVTLHESAVEREKDYLAATVRSMLLASSLIYRYANLRKLINDHDPEYISEEEERPDSIVSFNTPSLIVTQKGAQTPSMDRYLKYPITAAAILQFVKENRHHIDEVKGEIVLRESSDGKGAEDIDPLPMEEELEELQMRFDADIEEFDDEFNTEELVFGVVVNRSEKRITVVFRGSVVRKDWQTNFNCSFTTLDQFNVDGNVAKVHSGYANYIFGPSVEGPCKYERILKIIRGLKQEQSLDGYDLFVTGHSLGGALSSLLSFGLAANEEIIKDFKYVTALSFASPPVGNEGFNRVSESLELQGKLRHVRVSNQGDMIATAPFRLVPPFPLYKQSGINLHALGNQKKMEVGYPNRKSTSSQLWDGNVIVINVAKMHTLGTYEDRMLKNAKNVEILCKTIENLYEENVWYPETEE